MKQSKGERELRVRVALAGKVIEFGTEQKLSSQKYTVDIYREKEAVSGNVIGNTSIQEKMLFKCETKLA